VNKEKMSFNYIQYIISCERIEEVKRRKARGSITRVDNVKKF